MAAQKFGLDPRTPLYNSQTRSHAPLDSEMVKALAGRSAGLYELATGDLAGGTDEAPVAPLNPSGRVGHDHSGPPYGSAIQHPLWAIGSCQTASVFSRDDGTNYYDNSVVGITADINPTLVCKFYCRPFPEYEGSPYSRAYLSLTAIHGVSSGTLYADLWSADNPDDVQSASTTINDTAWPPTVWSPTGAYWRVRPGWNTHYLRLRSSNTNIVVYSVSANQIVKRSH